MDTKTKQIIQPKNKKSKTNSGTGQVVPFDFGSDSIRVGDDDFVFDDFVVLSEPRLLSYDPDCVFDTEDGYFLLTLKSHPCYFLDLKTNLCKIHQSAPLSCRRYPYTVAGKLNARFCPILPKILFGLKGADIGKAGLVQELNNHKKIVAEWNKKSAKKTKTELLSFIFEKAAAL